MGRIASRPIDTHKTISALVGADGLSAYQIAVNNSFIGTEEEWLLTLKGDKGDRGIQGLSGADGADGTTLIGTVTTHNHPTSSFTYFT